MSHDPQNPTAGTQPQKPRGLREALAPQDRKVIVLAGGLPGESKTFRLDKERLVLGSVISADVRLIGDGVAPIHAVLELQPEAVIYDLASDTGVFVNGAKIVTKKLQSGDTIIIGRNTFKFSVENRAQQATHVGKDRVRETGDRKLFLNPDEDFKPLLLESSEGVDQIFDYRPSTKQALEVVMSWCDSILNIEHFVTEKQVTIGHAEKNDFGVPPLLSSSHFPVVTRTGEDFALNLDPQMKGVVQRQGELRTLDQLRASALKGPLGHQVTLGQDDFAKISVGEVDFYLSFTQAPPRLKRGRLFDRDPLFLKIFASSMVLTVLTIYGLLNIRVVPNLEAEQIPERIATILYQPEKYTPKPKIHEPTPKAIDKTPMPDKPVVTPPKVVKTVTKIDIKPNQKQVSKPVPKVMDAGAQTPKKVTVAKKGPSFKGQTAAKEGQGAKAKGAEGARGTKTAAVSKTPQKKAAIPDPNGGKGSGTSHSQTPDIGNVDFLKGASGKIENILAGAGAQLGKGGDTLKGLGGFDTRGTGGSALTGTGKGGGGTSDLSAGLGNSGRGFGRVGTGLGAAGSGNGIIGGQSRVALRTGGADETVVMGSIDADAIEAAIMAHRDEFRLCYEKEINAEHPALAGRVGTTFVIGSSGRVSEAGIESTTLKNANVERCVVQVIKRIDFPMPRGGGVVQVTYPFKYSPVGR